MSLTDDDKLVIGRALRTEIEAFERRMEADKQAGRQTGVAVIEYHRKLTGALTRIEK